MTVRDILIYPQHKAKLRRKSDPVGGLNKRVVRLILDLKDTLQASSDGIGLAAPQINNHKRVVVVRLGAVGEGSTVPGLPVALINPEIIEFSDERKDFDGCLSFPGLYGETSRPHRLRVTGLGEDGKSFDRFFEGFDAVVVHHEIDHLDGVLFIDRIENWADLYTVGKNSSGELVRVPITVNQVSDCG
jgi:peptide deformylase